MVFDLHSHTLHSDGVLTRNELVARAAENGVDVLAITDHDNTESFVDKSDVSASLTLIPGIELSTQWQSVGIHVLGLNIDPHCDAMQEATKVQGDSRLKRAAKIAENLARKGIEGTFEGAMELSHGRYIGRPHFARHLIDTGRVDSMHTAFKNYLGDGKAGDVKKQWAELPRVVEWIRTAGGVAVLAHPLKYKLTRTRLKRLLDAFVAAGGEGMEVVSARQTTQQTRDMAQLCEQSDLLASCGSDFHAPGSPWAELGRFSPLPAGLKPVWERF